MYILFDEGSSSSSIWKMNSGQGALAGGGQRRAGHRIPQSRFDRLSVGVYTPWYISVFLSKLMPVLSATSSELSPRGGGG